MNKHCLVLALAASSAFACHKQEPPAADAGPTQTAGPAQTVAPTPFAGTLTSDRVMGAKGLAHPFEKWTDIEPKLEAQLGKPTFVKDGKMYMWAVSQGDDCTYVEVEKQKDGTVGIVSDPMKVSKSGPVMNWDECQTAAGVRKEAADDPNAPGPPAGGKVLSVLELKDGASKARSKWDKAKVTVKGLYVNVTSATVNGTPSATVTLTAAKGDLKNTVSCELADPKSAPSKLLQYAPIKVTGTVQVQDMMSLGGNRSVRVSLESCAIAK